MKAAINLPKFIQKNQSTRFVCTMRKQPVLSRSGSEQKILSIANKEGIVNKAI